MEAYRNLLIHLFHCSRIPDRLNEDEFVRLLTTAVERGQHAVFSADTWKEQVILTSGLQWPEEDVHDGFGSSMRSLYISPVLLACAAGFSRAVHLCVSRAPSHETDKHHKEMYEDATKGHTDLFRDVWAAVPDTWRIDADVVHMIVLRAAGRGHVDIMRDVVTRYISSMSYHEEKRRMVIDTAAFSAAHNGEIEALRVMLQEFDAVRVEEHAIAEDAPSPLSEYDMMEIMALGHADAVRLLLDLRPGLFTAKSICANDYGDIQVVTNVAAELGCVDLVSEFAKLWDDYGDCDADCDNITHLMQCWKDEACDVACKHGRHEVVAHLEAQGSTRRHEVASTPSVIVTSYESDCHSFAFETIYVKRCHAVRP